MPQLTRGALDALPSQIAVLDAMGTIIAVNQAWKDGMAAAARYPWTDLQEGVNYLRVCESAAGLDRETAAVLALGIRTVMLRHQDSFLVEILCPGGEHDEWFAVRIARFPAPNASDTLVVFDNITERKRWELELQQRASYDQLTGLPNRETFLDHLQQLILSAGATSSDVALMLMDLDGFKDINDTFGHHTGDALLRQVAQRLRTALDALGMVARLGGDEFSVVVPNVGGRQGAMATAAMVLDTLEPAFHIEGLTLDIRASLGIVLAPEHGADAETLLRRSDMAMYTAKRSGSGYAVYTASLDQLSPDRLSLMGDLRQAISQGEFFLAYQPQVRFDSREVAGAEALLRWRHPRRGLVMPGQFIPLAEQSGLIHQVSRWVLNEALRQAAIWQRDGLNLPLALNFSAHDLDDPELFSHVETLLQAFGVAPSRLKIEITESSLMAKPEQAVHTLNSLRALGIRIAIDDFGTGYSSMAYLKRLSVDELKIDKSFVQGIRTNDRDKVITRSTIDLAHNLGLEVVAEGIEDEETWSQLLTWDCDIAQGYFLTRPLRPPNLVRWLRRSAFLTPRIERRFKVVLAHGECRNGYKVGDEFTCSATGEFSPALCEAAARAMRKQGAALVRGAPDTSGLISCPISNHMLAMELCQDNQEAPPPA